MPDLLSKSRARIAYRQRLKDRRDRRRLRELERAGLEGEARARRELTVSFKLDPGGDIRFQEPPEHPIVRVYVPLQVGARVVELEAVPMQLVFDDWRGRPARVLVELAASGLVAADVRDRHPASRGP